MTMTAGTGDTCQNKLELNCQLCGVKKIEGTFLSLGCIGQIYDFEFGYILKE
jgi:hypothetical protein